MMTTFVSRAIAYDSGKLNCNCATLSGPTGQAEKLA